MMNTNKHILIQLDRYGCEGSQVNVVTDEFLQKWLDFNAHVAKISTAPIAVLEHDVNAWDSEEVSYIWYPTDKEVSEEDQEFMDEFLQDIEEED